MISQLLPILIALTVVLLVWGIGRALAARFDGDRKKLKSRLTLNTPEQLAAAGQRPITHRTEAVGFSAILARWSPLQSVHKRLLQAWPDTDLTKFLGIALGLALLGGVGALLATGSTLIASGGGLLGGTLPFLMLGAKRTRRQRALADQLPEALDFLSRVLRAGHSFSTGLQMLGEELPEPLAIEFRRAYDQHTLGQSVPESLKDMAERIDSGDFAFFVTAVLIQQHSGGDLSEVLRTLGDTIRGRIRLQQHVKAKTAEGRFTGYVLIAFPLVMFFLVAFVNPQYAQSLTGTSTGHKLLGTAFVLQVMGLWAIRKITTVRV